MRRPRLLAFEGVLRAELELELLAFAIILLVVFVFFFFFFVIVVVVVVLAAFVGTCFRLCLPLSLKDGLLLGEGEIKVHPVIAELRWGSAKGSARREGLGRSPPA